MLKEAIIFEDSRLDRIDVTIIFSFLSHTLDLNIVLVQAFNFFNSKLFLHH